MAASEMPDLILMDVALGEMDGWEATLLIKANPATSAIPIVALTAHALASDRAKSVEVGCSDFEPSRSICSGCWSKSEPACQPLHAKTPSSNFCQDRAIRSPVR